MTASCRTPLLMRISMSVTWRVSLADTESMSFCVLSLPFGRVGDWQVLERESASERVEESERRSSVEREAVEVDVGESERSVM